MRLVGGCAGGLQQADHVGVPLCPRLVEGGGPMMLPMKI